IGYRLKNSGSSITLTGTNKNLDAEKDNTKLSGDRAVAVKNYLVDVWQIPENRIKIQSRNLPSKPSNSDRPEGREENQRVEISSPDIAITAPLNLKDIVRTANPPKIELLPKLWSELGMDKWDLEISQKGKTLREFTGTGEGTTHLWDVEEEPIPSLEDPIDVKLTYSDKAGTKGELEKSLKVSQLTIRKKRSELKDDKRIERFSLILFDYDKAELTNAQKRILEDVKDKIKPNSKVIISGYADKTGDENYNKELAARRNAEVQKVLKVDDSRLVTMNIGSNELLYDNNSPEGRSYCRTVKVLVETPIND
ncbi:MAG: OmpA family protein, partial [Candidatus Kapabacteria bacterium]|nr:OmpA family protein [Candidatus Kapabacteria bacterium]